MANPTVSPAPDPIAQSSPKAGYLAYRPEIDAAIRRVLESGWYIGGPEVEAFEREFAGFVGIGHAIAVANGTDALALALRGLNLGPGDRVATVSHTAVATVAAIELAGAIPVLVDIDAEYAMDPEALAAALDAARAAGAPIKAVIAVHLYGQPAAIERIVALARAHGAAVIEDCAQAHGAALNGRQVGTFGDVGAFSFYPTKNLGALGDGGAVVTGDAALAARLAGLREYGWRERYVSETAGQNSRLDALQAAILRVKLAHLAAENARRRDIAAIYDAGLAGLALERPARRDGAIHVFHQYVVQSAARDLVRERLRARGVTTLVHYPVPVHLQPAYRGRIAIGPGGMARTERAAGRIFSLPMYAQMSDAEAGRVVAALRETAGG